MPLNTSSNTQEGEAGSMNEKPSMAIVPHQFTVDDVTYEWLDGAYYKKVSEIYAGKSFGELALLKDDLRKATIKCEDDFVHFATLDQKNFQNSLQRIEAKRLNHLIEFL